MLSFVAQWYILTQLGAGRATDAYFAALAVPVVILYLVGDPISRVALPLMSVKDETEHWRYAWTAIDLGLLLFLAIGLVLFLSVPRWIRYLVPGFDATSMTTTVSLIRILAVGMILQGTGMVARSAWNAHGSFIWPSVAAMIAVASSLIFLILTLRYYGVAMAAWAFNVRFGIEFLLLLVPIGHFARPQWKEVPILLRKARPLMLGAAYFRTDVLVDRVLTSLAPAGSLSLLYLAQQLLSASGQVINQSVVAPLIPGLAKAAHAADWDRFEHSVRVSTWRLFGLASLLFLIIVFLGRPVLSLVFSHRAMGSEEIQRLTVLIVALSGLLIADGILYFAYSAFYSAGDTATPTIATAILYSISVIAKIVAFMIGGVVALAVTISVYYFLNAFLLQSLLRVKLRKVRAQAASFPAQAGPTLVPLPPTPTVDSY